MADRVRAQLRGALVNRWVWRARRHHETGASALEYAALIAVAAALVGILIASGLPARVADGTEAGLCRLFQNPDNAAECEEPGDGSGTDGSDGTEGPGSDDPGGDSSGDQDAADELQEAEEAHADAEDAMDEVWDDILLELVELAIPLEDIEACLTEGDIVACITALIDLVPWTKALKLARRLPTIWRLANRFLDRRRELEQARERLEDARDACRRRSSFVPGTPVLLADGSRVPIEYVEVGDHVLATDPGTGRTSAEPVTDVITTSGIKILVEVGVAGGGTLTATATHPFWLQEDGEWVGAAELEVGDRLTVPGGGQVAVESLDTRVRPQRVHNLTVAEHHTYYVTVGGTDVLVHNTTAMCPPDNDADPPSTPTAVPTRPDDSQLPPAQDLIRNGTQYNRSSPYWNGRNLPAQNGPPGGTLYKTDPQTGAVTYYTVYDSRGNAIKRVDLNPSSRPHNGIPPPHVVYYRHDTAPDGTIHVREDPRSVRPANPDEEP